MIRLKRNEKILVVFLLFGIVASGGYFFYSSSSIKSVKTAENSLGYVKPLGTDVRLRSESTPSWGRVSQEANVFKNDRIYTGSSSSAVIGLKSKQKLTIEPNSMVIISDHQDSLNLDLKSGGFFGELKKGASLIVKKGKSVFEVKGTDASTTLRLESTNDQEIKLVVLKGEAALQSQSEPNAPIQKIVANDEAVISDLSSKVEIKPLSIHLQSPPPGAALWDDSMLIDFSWSTSDLEKAVTLEVSDDPLFQQNVKSIPKLKDSKFSMKLTPGGIYFWRVKDESSQPNRSPTASFSYYSLKGPDLPLETVIEGPLNWKNEITEAATLNFRDPSLSESYEVEISESDQFSKILYQQKSEKTDLQITNLKAGKLFWRVKSFHPSRDDLISNVAILIIKSNETDKAIPTPRALASSTSDAANPAEIKASGALPAEPPPVIFEEKQNSKANQIEIFPAVLAKPIKEFDIPKAPLPSNTTPELAPALLPRPTIIKKTFIEFWLWLGSGMNFQYYKQSIPNINGEATFQNIQGPTLLIHGGAQGKTFGMDLSYKETPGKMASSSSITVTNGKYNWRTLSTEGLYRFDENWNFRLGFQNHLMPFMVLDATSAILDVKTNTLTMLTFGFDRRLQVTSKLRAEWQMRYQQPLLSGSTDGTAFNVKPKFAFDGSVGSVYSLSDTTRLGIYWYGQWHQYSFIYGRGVNEFSGSQTLFYSNIEIRLGLEF